jgi:hypothetical protein
VILDVLADRLGDTGAVISGTREYAGLSERVRSRLTVHRRIYMAWQLLAGAGLLVFLPLILRAGPDWGFVNTALLGLFGVFLLLVPIIYLEAWESGRTKEARRRLTRSQRDQRFLVAPWYDALSLITNRDRKKELPEHPRTGLVAGVVLSILILLGLSVLIPIAWLGFFGNAADDGMNQALDGLRANATRWQQVGKWRELAEGVRTGELEDGGSLLWALLREGVGPETGSSIDEIYRMSELEVPPWEGRPAAGQIRLSEGEEGVRYRSVQDSLLSRVARDLSEGQVQWIRSLTEHPQVEAYTRAARARSLDLFTAAVDTTALRSWTFGLLPVFLSRSILNTFTALKHLRATLALREGNLGAAEQELLDVLSMGFHLREGATSVFDQSLAQEVIVAAMGALVDFYSATGRPEGEAMAATLSSLDAPSRDLQGTGLAQALDRMTPFDEGGPVTRAVRVVQADARGLPGVQWEAMALGSMAGECGSLAAMTAGPDAGVFHLTRTLGKELATTPSREVLRWRIAESFLPASGSREIWRLLGIPLPLSHRLPFVTGWFETLGWVMDNPRIPRCFSYQVFGNIYEAIY